MDAPAPQPKTGFRIPLGTLLNTATVAIGALIGLAIGARIPGSYQEVAMSGIALVNVAMGLKMFLQSKNIIIVLAAIAIGGMLGLALGLQAEINSFADWAKHVFGGSGPFSEAIVTTSILFCVGPMTLLGCIQDGLENKIELLAIKSTMDGITSIFFAATLGSGVLVTAGVVLVVQSALTFMARPLRPLANDPDMLAEVTAVGGIMLVGIALGILNIKHLAMASYIPALFLAPLFVLIARKWHAKRGLGLGL